MARTITIELDDDAAHMLWYSAHERTGGDEALALRQALDAYYSAIRLADFDAKERRIAEQPPIDPSALSPEEGAVVDRIRTTIDVDDELLGQAQAALGTSGLKDTVDAAFREVARRARRDRLADRVRSGRGIDRGREHFERVRPTR